jgi:hypothetical protein
VNEETFAPQVAVNGAGDAVVVWLEDDGGVPGTLVGSVWAQRFDAASGTWALPELVENADKSLRTINSRADKVAAGIDSAGNAFAAWTQLIGGEYVVRVRRYSVADDAWEAPEQIGDDTTTDDTHFPRIAVDAAGNAIAVWQQIDPVSGRYEAWANYYVRP